VSGKSISYRRYVCQNRNGQCDEKMHLWDMDKADQLILDLFKSIFADRQRLVKTIKSQLEVFGEDNEVSNNERDECNTRLTQIERALKKQQIAFEQDVINLDEYRERMVELRKEKQFYTQKLQKLNDILNKSDLIEERVGFIYKRLADKLDSIQDLPFEEKVFLIDSTFEAICISPDYKITDISFRL
jgi:hypothetical protein